MFEDDILREIRETREAFAKAHGYDIEAMVEHLRKLDEQGDRPVARLVPRRPTSVTVPESTSLTFDSPAIP